MKDAYPLCRDGFLNRAEKAKAIALYDTSIATDELFENEFKFRLLHYIRFLEAGNQKQQVKNCELFTKQKEDGFNIRVLSFAIKKFMESNKDTVWNSTTRLFLPLCDFMLGRINVYKRDEVPTKEKRVTKYSKKAKSKFDGVLSKLGKLNTEEPLPLLGKLLEIATSCELVMLEESWNIVSIWIDQIFALEKEASQDASETENKTFIGDAEKSIGYMLVNIAQRPTLPEDKSHQLLRSASEYLQHTFLRPDTCTCKHALLCVDQLIQASQKTSEKGAKKSLLEEAVALCRLFYINLIDFTPKKPVDSYISANVLRLYYKVRMIRAQLLESRLETTNNDDKFKSLTVQCKSAKVLNECLLGDVYVERALATRNEEYHCKAEQIYQNSALTNPYAYLHWSRSVAKFYGEHQRRRAVLLALQFTEPFKLSNPSELFVELTTDCAAAIDKYLECHPTYVHYFTSLHPSIRLLSTCLSQKHVNTSTHFAADSPLASASTTSASSCTWKSSLEGEEKRQQLEKAEVTVEESQIAESDQEKTRLQRLLQRSEEASQRAQDAEKDYGYEYKCDFSVIIGEHIEDLIYRGISPVNSDSDSD